MSPDWDKNKATGLESRLVLRQFRDKIVNTEHVTLVKEKTSRHDTRKSEYATVDQPDQVSVLLYSQRRSNRPANLHLQ